MQSLATGLDEEYKKPKNLADQVVRILDEDSVAPPDRLRLLLLYLIYRDGLLPADTVKLIAHAQLSAQDGEIIHNLALLGQKISRGLKDQRPAATPLFPRKQAPANLQEDYSLSRFQPALKSLLEEHCKGILDQEVFPYTKPQLEAADSAQMAEAGGSLRGAKPTWAKSRSYLSNEPRQRILVFMAGGATYSESRACYEISKANNKEVFLLTSHMLTPALFIRQVGDLSLDKRRLGIPAEQPKPLAPAHLFEPEPQVQPSQPAPQVQQPRPPQPPAPPGPPVAQMANLRVADPRQANGQRPITPATSIGSQNSADKSGKDAEKKKRLNIFSSKK